MATYEIPLTPSKPQSLTAALPGGTYRFAFRYLDCPEGGWIMDIADNIGNDLVNGYPLVTGEDLLGQFGYFGFLGKLYVLTPGFPAGVPTFDGLGVDSHLYYEV
jgi:hypothetical protein